MTTRWDARSYVAIHMSVIFGVGVLATGAIWARASWGKWWVWDEPTLVSFLIVFLLYVTYYPLRYSIEDPHRRARYASVFAITAGAFVPINFIAVRLAESLVHPRVLNQTAGDMPGEMRLTFLVALAGMALLYVTLVKLELTSKHARGQLRRLRRLLEEEPARRGAAPPPIATVPGEAATRRCPPCHSTRPVSTSPAPTASSSTLILSTSRSWRAKLQRIERELQRSPQLAEHRLQGADADGTATRAAPLERVRDTAAPLAQARPRAGTRAPTTRRSSTSPAARRWWSAPARSARARSRAC